MQEASKETLQELAQKVPGVQIQELRVGDILRGDGISIMTLHPEPMKSAASAEVIDKNEASLCLFVQMERHGKEMTLLLTGDVEGGGERQLTEELKRFGIHKIDILKCAHHGSKNATSAEFLDEIDARLAVISCGRRNCYGHPHEELLDRLAADGATILRTDQNGAVILSIKRRGGVRGNVW